MDVRKEKKGRQHTSRGERHSRVVQGQESQKVQQKRGVDKGRSDEPSKC